MVDLFKKYLKHFIIKLHSASSLLDNKYNKSNQNKYPPIFIIGPPRSGSTLLYQLILQSFKLAYIPNISNYFYMCPIFAAKCGIRYSKGYRSSFKSQYGYEKGIISPSEAGNIWNRWFPHEKTDGYNYTPKNHLNLKSKKEIFQLISWFQRIFDAPFISKNLKMSVRLQAIYEIFPDALIIKCDRDPAESSSSILKIRRSKNAAWWSVMPKEIETIKSKSEIEQVCGQVYYIEKNINDDLNLFNNSQILNVKYANICKNPHLEIDRINTFFETNRLNIKRKSIDRPMKVNKSRFNKNDDEDYIKIKKTLDSLYSRNS